MRTKKSMTLSSSDLKNCDGFMTSQIYFTTENRISRVMWPTLLFLVLWLYCSTFIIGHQTALFICIVRPAKAPQCSNVLMCLLVVKRYNNYRTHSTIFCLWQWGFCVCNRIVFSSSREEEDLRWRNLQDHLRTCRVANLLDQPRILWRFLNVSMKI